MTASRYSDPRESCSIFKIQGKIYPEASVLEGHLISQECSLNLSKKNPYAILSQLPGGQKTLYFPVDTDSRHMPMLPLPPL